MALVNVFSQKSFASSIPVFARVVDVQSLEKNLQIAQKADQPYVDTRTGKLRLNPFLDLKIAIKLESNGVTYGGTEQFLWLVPEPLRALPVEFSIISVRGVSSVAICLTRLTRRMNASASSIFLQNEP
jgi:hypothetical protein